MKKITLVSAVAAAAFAATAAFSATSVFAADEPGDTGTTNESKTTTSTKPSQATINLTPATDKDGNRLGVTLDAAPSIVFPEKTISNESKQYNDGVASGPITVTNNGTDDAWSVSVKADSFVDGTKTLKGAKLTLPAGTAKAADPSNQSAAPSTQGASLDLKDGSASVDGIFAAVSGAGVGTWDSTLAKSTLDVPAGNVAGNYSAALTWTLTDSVK